MLNHAVGPIVPYLQDLGTVRFTDHSRARMEYRQQNPQQNATTAHNEEKCVLNQAVGPTVPYLLDFGTVG